MIEPENPDLSISKQCRLLDIKRSTYYYKPAPIKDKHFELMKYIDRLYLKYPTFGTRRMTTWLRREGYIVGRKRVRRLMRIMGLRAIYPRQRTTIANMAHKKYPYLLRDLVIDRPNQVWATDITYIPMRRGFMYLVAVIDWYSRKVLSWRISNTLEPDFCIDALQEALRCHGKPAIFNTDQGSQFTSNAFISVLKKAQIRISMDGKGRWIDNVFIERLWRSVKYEDIYLKSYETGKDLREGLKEYFRFFNEDRYHQSLDDKTPDEVYYGYNLVTKVA